MSDGEASERRYELSLELPAAHRGVRIARNVLRSLARLWGLGDREIDDLLLVVSELLANGIDHGGGAAAMSEADLADDARVFLRFVIRAGEWSLSVTDRGGGDPDDVRRHIRTNGPPDLDDERGRGLFLLATMVDRMEVERSPDGLGLTMTATKHHGVR